MLKIRLQRVGRKHEPVFRLVVIDSHEGPKSGKAVEILGNYDSRRGDESNFKAERIRHWLSAGAQTSGTVHNLLVSKNIIEGKKINVLPKKKPIEKEGEGVGQPAPADTAEKKEVEKVESMEPQSPEPVAEPTTTEAPEEATVEQTEKSPEPAEKPIS